MCFTISFTDKAKEGIMDYKNSHEGVRMNFGFDMDYHLVNAFSFPELPIIKMGSIDLAQWGLVPDFIIDEEKADEYRKMTLNARNDTIFEKKSYKKAILDHRAVLVVDGFFEWRHQGGKKYPFYIYPKDKSVFYLGCIHSEWVNHETGEIKDTFSIITTDANPMMEYIHNTKKRMPLILHKSDIEAWVSPSTPTEQIREMMRPFEEAEMDCHTVSTMAGNPTKNRNIPEITDEVFYPELTNLREGFF